jgi:molybdopterin converting factor small subunit
MNVLVKFFVFDLPPGFADAKLNIPDGSTVGDVLDVCLELFVQRKVSMDVNEFKTATVMINGRWSDLGDPVSDGDTLTIIRPMDGG